ncbi:hypothetical protein KA005_52915, partial [bacterium]|nr:hypothetical protein [bacterium]
RMCAISVQERFSPNIPLLKFVLQNWDAIKQTFGNEFIARINNGYAENLEFWNQLYPVVDEYPSVIDDALSFIEKQNITSSSQMLQFLGRVKPKSEILLSHCLKSIQKDNEWEESVVAAELLGTHFAGDIDVKNKILGEELKFPLNGGEIIALCIGWTDCKELDAFYEYAIENNIRLIYPAFFHLICTKSDKPDKIYDSFVELLGNKESWIMGKVASPLIERLKKDEVFYRLLMKKLHNKPSSTEKATFPKMIGTSRGLSVEVRAWCISEIETQLSNRKSPEIGYDLFAGESRPVVHSLLEVLS